MNNSLLWSRDEVSVRSAKYVSGVYFWMMLGVAVSAISGFVLSYFETLLHMATKSYMLIFILQIGSVFLFSSLVGKLSVVKARILYLFYSLLTGVTVALVGMIYTKTSIAIVFLLAVLGFAGLASFGAVTKRNLGPIGSFCMMGAFMLFGMGIIFMIVSFFTSTSALLGQFNFLTGIIGTVVFSGLTAYDSQRIKNQALELAKNDVPSVYGDSFVISGAFSMYLNFINLFFSLLRLFGNRR